MEILVLYPFMIVPLMLLWIFQKKLILLLSLNATMSNYPSGIRNYGNVIFQKRFIWTGLKHAQTTKVCGNVIKFHRYFGLLVERLINMV